jgi:hypothetical protein
MAGRLRSPLARVPATFIEAGTATSVIAPVRWMSSLNTGAFSRYWLRMRRASDGLRCCKCGSALGRSCPAVSTQIAISLQWPATAAHA